MISLEDLNKRLMSMLDQYVTNLSSESPGRELERIQLDVVDSKLAAIAIGKLMQLKLNKDKKAFKKLKKKKLRVYFQRVLLCRRRIKN